MPIASASSTNEGEIIWGDYLLIIYARDVLARTGKGQSIIFDVKCSQALPEAIEKAGGSPGDVEDGPFADRGEDARDPRADGRRDVGAHVLRRRILRLRRRAVRRGAPASTSSPTPGRASADLLADVPRFVSTPEIRVDCPDDKKFGIVEEAKKHFGAKYKVIDVDGVRVLFGDGWGLIRASNTQPAPRDAL